MKRFKYVLLGDTFCGKSSLILRYTSKKFEHTSYSTIGCSFFSKTENINNIDYGLDIWDTAGQERYRTLLPMYYRDANVIFICIDITNKENIIENIQYWIDELGKYISLNRIIYIVGTKSDLVSIDEIDIFIKNIKKNFNLDLIITSSKSNLNVENTFKTSLIKIIEKYKNNQKEQNMETFEINETNMIIDKNRYFLNWCSIL